MPKTDTVKLYVIRRERKQLSGKVVEDFTYGVVIPKAVISRMKLRSGHRFMVEDDPDPKRDRIILNVIRDFD